MNEFLSDPSQYLTVGVMSGLIGGWLFYRLWRRIVPSSWSRVFWRTLAINAHRMLTCDEPSEMFVHYRALLTATAAYTGRSILGLLLATAPIVIIFPLLAAYDPSGQIAESAEVHPATVIGDLSRLSPPWRIDDERLFVDRNQLGESRVQLAGKSLDSGMLAEKRAFCRTTVSCLLFEMMLFETHLISPEEEKISNSVIVRPALLESNPFWPYLNDLEFWFFIAIMLGSAGAAWLSRRRDVEKP